MEQTKINTIKQWLGSGSINIFGRPFSGKDTQAQQLARLFDAPIIGGGGIIRASQNNAVKDIIDAGNLAPTQDYLNMVLPRFSQKEYVGRPLILSSVGRWSGEEQSILQALHDSKHGLKAAVLLDLTKEEVYERWETAKSLGDRGRRADDAHGILDVRLNEFQDKTEPVIDFYRRGNLLIEIDGSQPTEKVTQDILEALLSRAAALP